VIRCPGVEVPGGINGEGGGVAGVAVGDGGLLLVAATVIADAEEVALEATVALRCNVARDAT
jgi:hypothetical protein